jgi:hypothetical protein
MASADGLLARRFPVYCVAWREFQMSGAGAWSPFSMLVFGRAIAFGLMALMFRRNAFRWRRLARAYAQPWRETTQA